MNERCSSVCCKSCVCAWGKKVTGCVSVLRGTCRLSASWSYKLAGLSPSAVFFPQKPSFQIWVNGKWDAARKVIKKHGADKVSICHSISTASIFILSCIMRFAQNSSVCSQTEMSALGLSGWQRRSQMHGTIPTQHIDAERHKEADTHSHYLPFPVSLLLTLQTLVFSKVTSLLYL